MESPFGLKAKSRRVSHPLANEIGSPVDVLQPRCSICPGAYAAALGRNEAAALLAAEAATRAIASPRFEQSHHAVLRIVDAAIEA
jgi:hypothetical protein